jgi:hypothetical protein
MSAYTPLQLSPEDKLDALRYLDELHFWYSLDDKRLCQCCGRLITGRQIVVVELQGTRGKLELQCPSTGCLSTPMDWVGPSIGEPAEKNRKSKQARDCFRLRSLQGDVASAARQEYSKTLN